MIEAPFGRVIIDCVGPLPRTKNGNQYLFTMMCAATRFPEAVPLRNITAKSIVRALTKFFSTFGLPRVVQSDQGSNFQSRLFKQILGTLNVRHVVSSAYHPESQGALERWHQTLKSMLKKHCHDNGTDWDESTPFVLFAARDAVQESLGFSPAQLVFGHTLRGPLHTLHDQFLSLQAVPAQNVLDYVSQFRERLHRANALAKHMLTAAQTAMKRNYDRSAVERTFSVGDKVLALLPVPGTTLSAKFSGPYEVHERLSDTDYVLSTPDRRRKTRVCHINMLKLYHARNKGPDSEVTARGCRPHSVIGKPQLGVVALTVSDPMPLPDVDDVRPRCPVYPGSRLTNSEAVEALPTCLPHLSHAQRQDVIELITRVPLSSIRTVQM